MTNIDKSGWGDGPWQNEPDHKEWRDKATGAPCMAHRHPGGGHWCGYVAVAPGHPAYKKHYDGVDVNVHGGLTYSAECSGEICHVPLPGEPDNVWWLGFDCAHCGDMSPGYKSSFGGESYRALAYVKGQCADLAKQLAGYTGGNNDT